jgi:hypothetical protein
MFVTVVNDDMVELESIDDLIKKFNETHNTGQANRFVTLGDPRQSGATLPHEGVFYETSLKVRRAHPIAYMDFSLDQETAFGRQSRSNKYG